MTTNTQDTPQIEGSEAYKLAYAKHNVALKAYAIIRDLYLAGRVDDAAFMEARAAMDAADAEFDIAFSRENGW